MKNLFYTPVICTLALFLNACNGGGSSGSSDGGGSTPPANTSNFMMVGSAGQISQLTNDNNAYESVIYPNISFSGMTVNSQGEIFAVNAFDGLIMNSTDGVTWNYQSQFVDVSKIGYAPNIAVNNNGRFVVTGNGRGTWTSADGKSWIQTSSTGFQAITTDNNKFIATGYNGLVETSTDGISWEVLREANGNPQDLRSITIDKNDNLVAVGGGSNGGQILTRLKENLTWKITDLSAGTLLFSVAVNDAGKFVAVGGNGTIVTSTDAVNWTPVTSPTTETLGSIAVNNNGRFVAVGSNGTIVTSADGNNWVQVDSGSSYYISNIIVDKAGKFIATAVGTSFFYQNRKILTSTDGIHWTEHVTGTNSILRAITYGTKHKFVTVGDSGVIFQSNDGKTWDVESSGLNCASTSCYLLGVTSNNRNKLVAVGFAANPFGIIINSIDGKNWQFAANMSIASDTMLYGITSNSDGRFFTVGYPGAILTSADGDNWSSIDSGTTNWLTAIALSSQGRFVAIGQSGTIITSSDGYNWTTVTPFTPSSLWAVASNSNGRFVAVGDNGAIFTSIDGINWTPVNSGTTATLLGVSVNSSGKFVAVGGDNVVITSSDGLNWSVVITPPSSDYGFTSVVAY